MQALVGPSITDGAPKLAEGLVLYMIGCVTNFYFKLSYVLESLQNVSMGL